MLKKITQRHIESSVYFAESLYRAYFSGNTYNFLVDYFNRPKVTIFGASSRPTAIHLWAAIIIYKAYTYTEIKPISHERWERIVFDLFNYNGIVEYLAIDEILNDTVVGMDKGDVYKMVSSIIDELKPRIDLKSPEEIQRIDYNRDSKADRVKFAAERFISNGYLDKSGFQDYVLFLGKRYKVTIQEENM